jgi:hypothetical protein
MAAVAVPVLLAIWIIGVLSLPSIIAIRRKVPHVRSVIWVNVLLGWTFFGWLAAMRMACRSKKLGPIDSDAWVPRDG